MDRSKVSRAEWSITAGSDFLNLRADQVPERGIAEWLVARVRRAIADGELPVGSRLPATRTLADELRVSRGVVTEVYRRLGEDGHVAGRGRGGTVVVAAGVRTVDRPPPAAPSPQAVFAALPGPDVFDTVHAAPARVDLTPGLPDLSAFPRAAWLRAERAVMAAAVPSDFGYPDPAGAPALRRAVARALARSRGIVADWRDVMIVAGVAQGLGLLAQVLRDAGIPRVAVEEPGSLGIKQHLWHWGIETPPVPVDADGVRVDLLRESGARAVLLTPAHQFPTGVVLSGDRRRELMRWADEGGLVIEDDYDAEHRYDRPPVPALRSVLAEQVWYTGSVSKLLAPALRVGWIVVPRRFRDAFIDAKRYADLGSAALPQLALARLMASGELERQLRLLRNRHRTRRDAMLTAIRSHLPGVTVHGAAAGVHLMITLDRDADDRELAVRALENGVKVHPLSWHRQRPGPPGFVLGYAANPGSVIDEGIALLGHTLRG